MAAKDALEVARAILEKTTEKDDSTMDVNEMTDVSEVDVEETEEVVLESDDMDDTVDDLLEDELEEAKKDEDDEELEEMEDITDRVDGDSEGLQKKAANLTKKMKDPKMKPSDASGKIDKPSMKEHVDAIFDGEELTEELRDKAVTIFEAAVTERVNSINEELHAEYTEKLEESINETKEQMTTKLDDYLGYVVEEWLKDNELAIESGIKTEISESFLNGLHELFQSHYISVPDDKEDLIEGLVEKVQELESNLNESLERNIEVRKELIESNCTTIFNDMCKGLVDTDVEKFKALSEGLEFDTEDQYKEKLNVLRESYFNTDGDVSINEDVPENTAEEATPAISSPMEVYMNQISKSLKK